MANSTSMIPVGSMAPNFTLRDAHGERQTLSDFRGRSVVLYFYPEDDTPLCTNQACQFRDHHPDFAKSGCTVIGVSPDDQESHADFEAKHKLPFTLLMDEPDLGGEPRVSVMYGAWGDKNMYGRIVRAMLRTTYLIGPDGRVAKRWDRVKTPGHAAEVLWAVKALNAGELIVKDGKGRVREVARNGTTRTPRKPAKQRNRTGGGRGAGGRAAYAGVRSTRGKKNPTRSVTTQDKGRRTRAHGKMR